MPRLDLDATRIACALNKGSLYRVWAVGREVNRGTGQQWLSKDALHVVISTHDVRYTRHHLNRLLKIGNGQFWTLRGDTIVFHGIQRVSQMLVEQAARVNPLIVATNRPGSRGHYIDLGGSLADFEARVFAEWIDGKTIALETVCNLWRRTRQQVYNWRRRAHITITENHAQTNNVTDRRIPSDGNYPVWVQVDDAPVHGIGWRLPNTYHNPEPVKEHPRWGQGRKIRKAVNALLYLLLSPADSSAGSPDNGQVQYWANRAALKRSVRHVPRSPWHKDYLTLGESRGGRVKHDLITPGQYLPNTAILPHRAAG